MSYRSCRHVYLTYSVPLGWQAEVLTNSKLFGANSSILPRVRLHPVYPGSLNAFQSGNQQLGGCCWWWGSRSLKGWRLSAVRMLPIVARACRCIGRHTLSTQGGVCKTCGSVSLATWSTQTCGSECRQAWSSSIKLQWDLWFQLG